MAIPKEIIRVGQIEIRFLMDEDDTDGRQCVFEVIVSPGARVPAPHYHEFVDELIYGLEGTITYIIGAKDHQIAPGDSCFAPRNVVHQFINNGSHDARFLSVYTPALIGPAYFRDLAELYKHGKADPIKIAEVMRSHGLIVQPPAGI